VKGRTQVRVGLELRLRLYCYGVGGIILGLCGILLYEKGIDVSTVVLLLMPAMLVLLLLTSLLLDEVRQPLQTLANVVAALREDDYSFRARAGRREDALGELVGEINALADDMQSQRAGALEAMALTQQVMRSMQTPVLAFDGEQRLRLLNPSATETFGLGVKDGIGKTAKELQLEAAFEADPGQAISLEGRSQSERWIVKRSPFRLRGVPHTLLVLSNASVALRDEERIAWKRLIRVLGHEINNSLTPIKSIAGSLRRTFAKDAATLDPEDFVRGLEVIEDRSESLNRFLQAYRELTGLSTPQLASTSLRALVERMARLELRVPVKVQSTEETEVAIDRAQIEQAVINLVRNAAEAALARSETDGGAPEVALCWKTDGDEIELKVQDNGTGVANATNLFVPFYTTKPEGTGIGLVLAQQIAEAHGGSLHLENRDGDAMGCVAVMRFKR
jgi:nitrogen fixation/metabolism regulation signal transduction histidine kinase